MSNPFFIADAHMHLGEDWYIFIPGSGFDALIASMKRFGIKRAYSSHYRWLSSRFKEAVAASIEGYERSEGAIPFLGAYDPRMEKESLNAFDKCLKEKGFVGIKIHPSFHGVSADDGRYAPVWKYASQQELPVLSHTWSVTDNPVQKLSVPHLFTRYIEEYPDVKFILGHSGGRGEGQKEAVALAQKYENVHMDIAGDIFCLDLIARMVKSVGAEKILFGTDWPWFDAGVYIPRILLSPISEKEKAFILGLNALRIFEPELYEMKIKSESLNACHCEERSDAAIS